jgi:nitroreductase
MRQEHAVRAGHSHADAVDFFSTVEKRRSVRSFQAARVPPEALARVLEAANRAPSAGDLQAYDIVVVTEPDAKVALARAAHGQDFIAQAPVVIVFCADAERAAARYGDRGAELFCVQDATIAAAYAQLAAAALGLGTVWVGAFDPAAAAKVVGAEWPICIMPLGLPAEYPEPSPRRSLDDLVHRERARGARAARR